MQIQLLGPLTAEIDGASIAPNAGKPRQILALLALRAGRAVPVATLMEELWGAEPPHSAGTTLQTYVLGLRRRIGAALRPEGGLRAKDLLATRYGGYLLQIPPTSVDAHRYEQIAAAGAVAFDAGDDPVAAQRLGAALDLWRGPALVDVPVGPVLSAELARYEAGRVGSIERRIDAELRLGRHFDLIAELAELTARYPQHEGLHAQAMVALYRSGRQASSLAIYRELRERLVDDLGVEPSASMQRLHRAILAADPSLDTLAGPHPRSTFARYAA